MLSSRKKAILAYMSAIIFIAAWWFAAYKSTQTNFSSPFTPLQISVETPLRFNQFALQPISREKLHDALSGDTQLMIEMMADWDIEAQILASEGYKEIKRLDQDKFILAQKLGRSLPSSSNNNIFLPQSYLSASFLLALAAPEQIAAIPAGLRRQTQLYPPELTNKVAIDLDSYGAEKIFLKKPKIAFTAPYSSPSIIDMLHRQNIELCCMNQMQNFSGLLTSLKIIGEKTGNSEKAELMALFMQAAMHAIENRLALLKGSPQQIERITNSLCVNYNLHFSAATSKMIIGELTAQIGINQAISSSLEDHLWKIPLEHEKIASLDPYCLIVSTIESPTTIKNLICRDAALAQLTAVQNNRVYIVDEETQESTSQFIILAYFDLYLALAHAIDL